MREPNWTAIAAMASNRAIGAGGRLPWHCPEDFRWFKSVTMGQVLLMGRKTFVSIGRPLPGRETWVLSRSGTVADAARTVASIDEARALLEGRKVFVAGGAEIYRATQPFWGEVLLTRFPVAVEGDAFFPEFESEFVLAEVIRDSTEFRIERWVR